MFGYNLDKFTYLFAMDMVELHYTPDQLRKLNGMLKSHYIMALSLRDDPKIEEEIRVMNNYFEDIDTILDKGQFVKFEKGSIIEEMLGD